MSRVLGPLFVLFGLVAILYAILLFQSGSYGLGGTFIVIGVLLAVAGIGGWSKTSIGFKRQGTFLGSMISWLTFGDGYRWRLWPIIGVTDEVDCRPAPTKFELVAEVRSSDGLALSVTDISGDVEIFDPYLYQKTNSKELKAAIDDSMNTTLKNTIVEDEASVATKKAYTIKALDPLHNLDRHGVRITRIYASGIIPTSEAAKKAIELQGTENLEAGGQVRQARTVKLMTAYLMHPESFLIDSDEDDPNDVNGGKKKVTLQFPGYTQPIAAELALIVTEKATKTFHTVTLNELADTVLKAVTGNRT
jgi:hypothetical protein